MVYQHSSVHYGDDYIGVSAGDVPGRLCPDGLQPPVVPDVIIDKCGVVWRGIGAVHRLIGDHLDQWVSRKFILQRLAFLRRDFNLYDVEVRDVADHLDSFACHGFGERLDGLAVLEHDHEFVGNNKVGTLRYLYGLAGIRGPHLDGLEFWLFFGLFPAA